MDKLLQRTASTSLTKLYNHIHLESAHDTHTEKPKKLSSKPPTRKGFKVRKGKESEKGRQLRKPVSRKFTTKGKLLIRTFSPEDDPDIPQRKTFDGKYIKISDLVSTCGQNFRVGYDVKKIDVSSETLLRTKLENLMPSRNLQPQTYPSTFNAKSSLLPPISEHRVAEPNEYYKAAASEFWV